VGYTLLDFLCARFPYHTPSAWLERIAQGKILIREATASPNYILPLFEEVFYHFDWVEEPRIDPPQVVYEDDEYMWIYKPADVPVHRTSKIILNTMHNWVRRTLNQPEAVAVHRLDAETSGLILFAKNNLYASWANRNLNKVLVRKVYLALCQGRLIPPKQVHLPIGEIKGDPIRARMHVHPQGKASSTHFTPLLCPTTNTTLLAAELFSGRKHQIRTHLAHLGHPLVGDKMYDFYGQYYLKRTHQNLNDLDYQILGAPNHLLHAAAVYFHHPLQSSGQWITHTQLPPAWQPYVQNSQWEEAFFKITV
jgi:RluA family pseudouridine synthase